MNWSCSVLVLLVLFSFVSLWVRVFRMVEKELPFWLVSLFSSRSISVFHDRDLLKELKYPIYALKNSKIVVRNDLHVFSTKLYCVCVCVCAIECHQLQRQHLFGLELHFLYSLAGFVFFIRFCLQSRMDFKPMRMPSAHSIFFSTKRQFWDVKVQGFA